MYVVTNAGTFAVLTALDCNDNIQFVPKPFDLSTDQFWPEGGTRSETRKDMFVFVVVLFFGGKDHQHEGGQCSYFGCFGFIRWLPAHYPSYQCLTRREPSSDREVFICGGVVFWRGYFWHVMQGSDDSWLLLRWEGGSQTSLPLLPSCEAITVMPRGLSVFWRGCFC